MATRVEQFEEHLNSLGYGKYSIKIVRDRKPEPWRWVVPNQYWVDGQGRLRHKQDAERVLYFELYDERGAYLSRVYDSDQILDYIYRFKILREELEEWDEFVEKTPVLRRRLDFNRNTIR